MIAENYIFLKLLLTTRQHIIVIDQYQWPVWWHIFIHYYFLVLLLLIMIYWHEGLLLWNPMVFYDVHWYDINLSDSYNLWNRYQYRNGSLIVINIVDPTINCRDHNHNNYYYHYRNWSLTVVFNHHDNIYQPLSSMIISQPEFIINHYGRSWSH